MGKGYISSNALAGIFCFWTKSGLHLTNHPALRSNALAGIFCFWTKTQ